MGGRSRCDAPRQLILVDSSAWIEYLNGIDGFAAGLVHKALGAERVIIGDLVLVEVLQGIRHDGKLRAAASVLLAQEAQMLCGSRIAEEAAANYRSLRRRGVTIRGTIDVIIASWCIANDAQIIHNDRDMRVMEQMLGLRPYR